MLHIYVDADACPVKDEVLKVVARYKVPVTFVANQWIRLPQSDLIKIIVVETSPDAADNWIAENVHPKDICVTGDIELAARCLKKEAYVLDHFGKEFTEDSIPMAQTMRDLNAELRDSGEIKGYQKSIGTHDRSRFSSSLNNLVQKAGV